MSPRAVKCSTCGKPQPCECVMQAWKAKLIANQRAAYRLMVPTPPQGRVCATQGCFGMTQRPEWKLCEQCASKNRHTPDWWRTMTDSTDVPDFHLSTWQELCVRHNRRRVIMIDPDTGQPGPDPGCDMCHEDAARAAGERKDPHWDHAERPDTMVKLYGYRVFKLTQISTSVDTLIRNRKYRSELGPLNVGESFHDYTGLEAQCHFNPLRGSSGADLDFYKAAMDSLIGDVPHQFFQWAWGSLHACGFHAFYTPPAAIDYLASVAGARDATEPLGYVVGAVSGYGRIRLHDKGFRAQFMDIEAVAQRPHGGLDNLYGGTLPVVPLHDLPSFAVSTIEDL